LIKNYRKKKHL